MKTLGASAAAASLAQAGERALAAANNQTGDDDLRGPGPIEIKLNVNGQARTISAEPATTLLEALRLHLNLTGPKEICDRGACGGCSVIIDGKLAVSCMMLAVDAEGARIRTIEGLAKDGSLDPIQENFIRHDAMQCGYCTPGFIIAGRALLDKKPKPTLPEIKKALSGNICRCGTYTNIFNAILEASGQPVINDPAAP
jgi:aerobic-type carbon monoxide dehydrogenase small subunit (CoxS/CutS family)